MELGTGTRGSELRNIVLRNIFEGVGLSHGLFSCLSGKAWRSPLCKPKSFSGELAKGPKGRRPMQR